MTKFAVALAFLGLNFYVYYFLATEAVIPKRDSFEGFPLELGEWTCAGQQQIPPEVERNLGVSDYLVCDFVRRDSGDVVSLYVGYHATQVREEGGGAGENSIHPPAHCLPGSGWDVIHSETVTLDAPGIPRTPRPAKRLVVANGERRALVYYWYQSRGRVIAEDWKKILYMGWDRATRRRTDGALVRFMIPVSRGDETRADAEFRALAPQVLDLLPAYLPS